MKDSQTEEFYHQSRRVSLRLDRVIFTLQKISLLNRWKANEDEEDEKVVEKER